METHIQKRNRLQGELDALKKQYTRNQDAGLIERMSNVKSGIVKAEREIVREAAGNPQAREETSPPAQRTRKDTSRGSEDRDSALRAIEERMGYLSPEAGDRLDDLVRRDRSGVESRYIAAVSDPHYEDAYGKRLMDPEGAQYSYTPEESEAVRRVAEAAAEQRALGVGSGAVGQFAIPASLDPSINLVSDGRVNPIRQLATVKTIATDRWQGVNSEGVVASWYAEASEVTDDSPTLSQPEITPERLSIWVPFSIEAGGDWPTLQAEMGQLFADAKDELEAQAFTLGAGSGSNQPEGLLIGGTISVRGGTATTPENYYDLQEALPPRYQARATFLSSNTEHNRAYRSVAQADTDEPRFVSEDRSMILGKPWREASHMVTTAAGTVAVYGDIAAGYTVVDRIGATTELVQTVFGRNQRPTGQRGLFFYARVGGEVTNPNAVRKLVTS